MSSSPPRHTMDPELEDSGTSDSSDSEESIRTVLRASSNKDLTSIRKLATEVHEKLTSSKDLMSGNVKEAEQKAKEESERKAKEESERKAKEESERKAKEESERRAKEEVERKIREEAEVSLRQSAKEEAERKIREEAERMETERRRQEEAENALRQAAKEEAVRKSKEATLRRKEREEIALKLKEEAARAEAERKAKAHDEHARTVCASCPFCLAKVEADRKALEEQAIRKAREEADQRAAERRLREEADRRAREEAAARATAESNVKKVVEPPPHTNCSNCPFCLAKAEAEKNNTQQQPVPDDLPPPPPATPSGVPAPPPVPADLAALAENATISRAVGLRLGGGGDVDLEDYYESVDPELLRKGFGDDDVSSGPVPSRDLSEEHDADVVVAGDDDGPMETEDWAEQELRALRAQVQDTQARRRLDRRPTVNGIEVAPRSELSPPEKSPEDLPRAGENSADFEPVKSPRAMGLGKKLKLGSKQSSVREQGEQSRSKVTLLRGSSKSANQAEASSSALTDSQKLASYSSPSPSPSPPPPAPPAPKPFESYTMEESFRHMIDATLRGDETLLHTWVLTLGYFCEPMRGLCDIIAEYDANRKGDEASSSGPADDDDAVDSGPLNPKAEAALKVLAFWVSHLWGQFESSEPLMTTLNQFVFGKLKGTRWGKRLKDTINNLAQGSKTLKEKVAHLQTYERAEPIKEDLLLDIDPEQEQTVTNYWEDEVGADSKEPKKAKSTERNSTQTFVGAESYTVASRPIGIADLFPEPLDDDSSDSLEMTSNAASRPMGLFELMSSEEQLSGGGGGGGGGRREMQIADDGPTSARVRASDLAKQLTVIEILRWKMVSPLELQKANWKSDGEGVSQNIRALINWHNRVALWVQVELLRGRTVEERTRLLCTFLCVAVHLERLQNYHTLFSIVAGLKVNLIARLHLENDLKPKWRGVFDRLCSLASTRDNWSRYRSEKGKATKFPFLPFVGVYLQDVQVLEAKEKTFVGETKAINFDKMHKLAALFRELIYVQRASEYRFKLVPRLLTYLLSFQAPVDGVLWDLSLGVRPSEASETIRRKDNTSNFVISTLASPRATSIDEGAGGGGSIRKGRARAASDEAHRGAASSSIRMVGTQSGHVPRIDLSPRGGGGGVGDRSPRGRPTSPKSGPGSARRQSNARDALSPRTAGVTAPTTSNIKQHVCPVCEIAFSDKEALLNHLESGGPCCKK